MKTTNVLALFFLILLTINTTAQESAPATGYASSTVLLNCSFGMGTFAAGENVGGAVLGADIY
jgi:hypothetical protein